MQKAQRLWKVMAQNIIADAILWVAVASFSIGAVKLASDVLMQAFGK